VREKKAITFLKARTKEREKTKKGGKRGKRASSSSTGKGEPYFLYTIRTGRVPGVKEKIPSESVVEERGEEENGSSTAAQWREKDLPAHLSLSE